MTDLSDKQLKIGYWWVTHKSQLKKWWVIILLVIDVLIMLFVLFKLILVIAYWSRDSRIPEKMSFSYINFIGYHQSNDPQDIKVIDELALPQSLGTQAVDLIAKVENPNQKWASENLQYRFKYGQATSDSLTTYLMPQETKYLLAYGLASEEMGADPKLVIESVNWQRIEQPAKLPLIDLQITDINPQRISLKDATGYSLRVSAKVTNQSIYSLKKVRFIVLLSSGGRINGFKEISLNNVESFSEREIEVVFKESTYFGTDVEIIPELNLLDEDNFYLPEN